MERFFDYTRSAEPLGLLLECLRRALAHELPNQLIAIQGLAREAEFELEDAGQAPVGPRNLLERVGAKALRAHLLCRGLAELIQNQHAEPAALVSLEDVVREAAAVVSYQGAGPPPDLHLAGGLPELTLPRRTLYHVFVELLRNATMASPNSVRINVGGERCPGGATFWVTDDGPGLPGSEFERLFEPFVSFSVPEPAALSSAIGLGMSTGERAGELEIGGGQRCEAPPPIPPERLGLGLFLIRQTVASWHGSLRVRSESGRGTTFTFFVPSTSESVERGAGSVEREKGVDSAP